MNVASEIKLPDSHVTLLFIQFFSSRSQFFTGLSTDNLNVKLLNKKLKGVPKAVPSYSESPGWAHKGPLRGAQPSDCL